MESIDIHMYEQTGEAKDHQILYSLLLFQLRLSLSLSQFIVNPFFFQFQLGLSQFISLSQFIAVYCQPVLFPVPAWFPCICSSDAEATASIRSFGRKSPNSR